MRLNARKSVLVVQRDIRQQPGTHKHMHRERERERERKFQTSHTLN